MKKIILAFKKKYHSNENFRIMSVVLMIWTLSRIIMLLMVPVMNIFADEPHNIIYYMNPWDAEWYAGIVDGGYCQAKTSSGMANWAFFPLYPIVCALLKTLSFGLINTYVIGMVVSNVCIIIATFYGVKLLKYECPDYASKWPYLVVLMMAGPFAFYAGSMYTEALFIMCVVLFFYYAVQQRFVVAGVWAALASATRIVGCTLIAAMIVEMYISRRYRLIEKMDNAENAGLPPIRGMALFKGTWKLIMSDIKDVFAIVICPVGTFIYMVYLKFLCGDAWAFYSVQVAWRKEKMFPVLGVLFKACTGQLGINYAIMGYYCVAVICLYIYMFWKSHYSMAVFGLISLAVPLTSHVMSTMRFIMGSFVMYIGVFELLAKSRKWVRILVTAVLVILEIFMIGMWYFWNALLM